MITKKRKEFRDSSAKENIDKLNQELIDIKNIMHENFDMILNRDKNLQKISKMSSDLKDNSKKVPLLKIYLFDLVSSNKARTSLS